MMRCVLFIILLAIILLTPPVGYSKEFYISTDGKDTNPGNKEQPFASLEKARDTIREMKKSTIFPAEGITVTLRGGKYFLKQTFNLNQDDSGSKEKPIFYAAYPGEEVRLIGGMELSPQWFTKVNDKYPAWNQLDESAKGKIYAMNLAKHGIIDYGQLRPKGYGKQNTQSPLELVFNNETMQLARWPNSGFIKTTTGENDVTFGYEGDRPSRWTNAPELWVFGYFKHGWADSYMPVKSMDIAAKRMTLPEKPVWGLDKDAGWYALNLLEELDAPGEYYLERKTGMLYFWPPSSLNSSEIFVSILGEDRQPLIQIDKASYITLKNLNCEINRFEGIRITNGDHITVDGGIIRNLGTQGISITGTNCGVENCEIYNVGSGGASVSGGDRHTLVSGNNFIRNCHIHHFSRLSRTYTPGIQLHGVGCLASHNLVHDAPHSGIMLGGNEHIIEFNDISQCCLESDDAGSFYSGRDWGARGNLIRFNFFHDIKSSLVGSNGVHAVYLDDCLSGETVFGNIFYNISGRAIMCGGGRDNIIENNVIVKCGSAHFTDRRGKEWAVDKPGDSFNLLEKIKYYNYTQPPWSVKYPKLAAILDNGYEQAKDPEGCAIRTNIGWQNKQWLEENCLGACGGFKFYTIENNIENQDPLFVNMEQRNFKLRPESPAFTLKGFQDIPFEEIGLVKDDASNVKEQRKSK